MRVESVERVADANGEGGGRVWAVGRGERCRVDTALVAPVAVGDWLLVFLGSARERIDARRAAEVNAALDLLDGVLRGEDASGAVAFELPSSMSAADLARLTGAPASSTP
jgi:hydrogenase expression/formation protein HypC